MILGKAECLRVTNHAGSLGFAAVAAGPFDELRIPEVLLQRRLEPERAEADRIDIRPAPEAAARGPRQSPARRRSAAVKASGAG